MKSIVKHIHHLTLALVIFAGAALAQAVSAATIEFDVVINNYGYVRVRPEANTGGAILWDASRSCWYTDRVNRGERLYIYLWPAQNERTGPNTAVFDIWCTSQHKYLVAPMWLQWYGSCWYREYVVTTDPNQDNNYVEVATSLPTPSKRIPIGYRKP